MLPGWEQSAGASLERQEAEVRKIPIYYGIEQVPNLLDD
jgi:hypothetical protein